MARPKKTAGQRRTIRIQIRLTPDEETHLLQHANGSGLSMSDFIRHAALGSKPLVQKATPERAAFIKGLAELGKIDSNINQIARATNRMVLSDQSPRVPGEVITAALHGLQTLSIHLINDLTNGNTR